MAPDENDKKDLEIKEDSAAGMPDASDEKEAEEAIDIDVDVETGMDSNADEPVADSVALSATGTSTPDFDEVEDFDQDLDVDITGDENIDFADEGFDGGNSGAGLKKVLAPVLVLVIAAGIGGYIVMNPQILGSGTGVPEPKVTYKAPDPGAFSTAAPQSSQEKADTTFATQQQNPFGGEDLPQPTTNQNEAPRTPTDLAALKQDKPPVAAPDNKAAAMDEEEAPFDVAADMTMAAEPEFEAAPELESEPEAAPASQPDIISEPPPVDPMDITEVGQEAPVVEEQGSSGFDITVSPEAEPGAEQSFLAETETGAGDIEPAVEMQEAMTPMDEDAVFAVAEESASSSGSDSFQTAQADIEEAPDVEAPPMPASREKAAPVRSVTETAQGTAQARVNPTAQTRTASDKYFEGVVPTGAMADVGPRKVDPELEPATQFVVVKKNHGKTDIEATLVSARRALKLKRYDSALDIYNKLYEKNPRDPRILMGLAVAQQNTGLTESAIRTYEEVLEVNPKNPDAMLNMLGLLRQQYPSVALRRLMDLYDKYPDNAGIAAQIGITQADLKHYNEAMRYLGIAASLQPQNAQHVFNMAIIADRNGETASAIKFYQQALELDAVHSSGQSIPRENIYDRLAALRRR